MSTKKNFQIAEEMRKALQAFRAQTISTHDIASDEEILATLATDETITPETLEKWRDRKKEAKEKQLRSTKK